MAKITNTTNKTNIISTKIEFKDSMGRTIKGYLDKNDKSGSSFIVISPGYGEIKSDYISTSYYLITNGFQVLRYDCPNHVGESDGEIVNFKLTDIETSMQAAINYLENKFNPTNIGMIASSLSARVALKFATKEKRLKYLINLAGVTNIRKTLLALHKEDLFNDYKHGKQLGAIDILGFEVRDDFLKEAIDNGYEDFNSTIEDVKRIDVPICYIVAGNDVWVECKEIKELYKHSLNKESKYFNIPGAHHQIQENPRLAKIAIEKMVKACIGYNEPKRGFPNRIKCPSIHDIVVQNKAEKLNLKNIFPITKQEEKKFWMEYLSKYYIIIRSRDYQDLLSLVAQLLNGAQEGDCFLDAGCGNGHFGAWLLYNLDAAGRKTVSDISFSYTGVDFVKSAILDAKHIHDDIFKKMDSKNKSARRNYDFKYMIADLKDELPFENDSFNKICLNLVISYIKETNIVLSNLYRKLKNGGKIVISSLKPYSDLSLIYKNYLDRNIDLEYIVEGRKLLNSAGKIRQKEKYGHYRFFDENELVDLMKRSGFVNIKTYRSFGNQANVVIGEKRKHDN